MTHCARFLLAALAVSSMGGCSNNYLSLPAPPMYTWPQVNQTWVQFMALTPEERNCLQKRQATCRTAPARKVPAGKGPLLSPPHAP